jgi:AraC-like DNA-binding protein
MSNNAPDRIRFSTDTLPERDRFPAFCEGMLRNIVGIDIVRLGSEPFRGALDIRRAGGVTIADILFTAANMTRDARRLSDGNDTFVIQLWKTGRASTNQGKHENRVQARDMLIIDNAEPAQICADAASRFWALTIPRESIVAALPDVTSFTGTKLANNLAFRLLSNYLEALAAEDFLDPRAADLFGVHLVDLTVLALGATGEAQRLAEQRGGRSVRRTAILHEIESSVADPKLDAEIVAVRLGITPRYVHMLLEETGQTFSEHLLEKRLARAVELLRDPRQLGRKIADIAFEVGFIDLSHFNRSFRRKFGATPTDVRDAAQKEWR